MFSHLLLINERIYFTSDSLTLKEYENVKINRSTLFYRSTKPNVTKGSWYYEVTHKSGNSRSVVGFCIDKQMEVSTTNENDKFVYYYILKDQEPFTQTSISVPTKSYTLGLGLDIQNSSFLIRYNEHDIKTYKFPDGFPNDKSWNIMLRPRGQDESTNVYDINFGYKDFKYGLPYGFTPWSDNLKFLSLCFNKNLFDFFQISLVYISIFIIK